MTSTPRPSRVRVAFYLRAFLAGLCLVPAAAPLAATVGVATVTDGEVRLIRGDALYSLVPGVDVQVQDVVTTGEDGYAQLEMTDGSVLNVDSSSKVYLSEYRLRQDDTVQSATVSVLVGLLRFVASSLRPDSSYELATNHMTIGIRGTEGVIEASEDDSRLLVEEGRVEVFELDEEGNLGARRAVAPGELVERRRARRLRLRAAAAEFRARLPARLRRAPQRRLQSLARRHVRARKLRDVDYEDVRRLMRANPRIRKSLRNRFERRMQDPRFRERMRRELERRRQGRLPAHRRGRASDAPPTDQRRETSRRKEARAAEVKRKVKRARRRSARRGAGSR